jgi:hypothetical protein
MATATDPKRSVKVADEVWIAAALLHREHPDRHDFTPREIEERARQEGLTMRLRRGVYVHAVQHCVANRRPDSGRYRMLVETGAGRRRLFRPGDAYHPAREGAKYVPDRAEIPPRCHDLLDWYARDYASSSAPGNEIDPILALRGIGKHLFADEHADEYVARLRRGWD